MEIHTENKAIGVRRLVATTFMRKMRGGSQSSLLQAEDGNFYIVKLLQNPQGSEVLFNEALGTALMQQIGLPVPEWCAIEISDKFIDNNRGLWFETGLPRLRRPCAGLHFGSRFVAPEDSESVYELLPRSWFNLIQNREDFVGALLFDLWAKQTDNRQAIFLKDENRSIRAIFIDQGCLFDRRKNNCQHKAVRPLFMDRLIYANLDIDLILSKWESRLDSLNIKTVVSELAIPRQWYNLGTFEHVVSDMTGRQISLGAYSSQIKMILGKHPAEGLLNKWDGQLDGIQIHRPQLRSDSHRRINRSMSCVGSEAI